MKTDEFGKKVSFPIAIIEQRMGFINYTDEFIEDCDDDLQDHLSRRLQLMKKVQSHVIGLNIGLFASPEFDIVGAKDQIPYYRVIITEYNRKNRPPCYDVKFKKY